VLVGPLGGLPTPLGTSDEPFLEEVRLKDILKGLPILAQSGRYGLYANGTSVKFIDDEGEKGSVSSVESQRVYLQKLKRRPRNLLC
jgi:hypothetical protein